MARNFGNVAGAGGANSDAFDSETAPEDGELSRLIEAWPSLPEDAKRRIVQVVNEHSALESADRG